jgi:PTS system nitrogen regulatory IIA component
MRQDAAWANVASIRNFDDRPMRDLHFGFASGSGRNDLFDFAGVDDVEGSPEQAPREREQDRTEITSLLEEQDIVLRMPARGKRSMLARMATRLGEKVGMSQGAVLAAMLRRERLGSTAIGNGVAIPHARLEGIPGPKAVLATLQHPIWFDTPDGKPVDLLLAVIWPKADTVGFLQALARFCRLLRHVELRDGIRAAEMSAEAMAWVQAFQKRTGQSLIVPVKRHTQHLYLAIDMKDRNEL